nr:DUF805 domain-containing protein [Oscillospiraceae bacterium]
MSFIDAIKTCFKKYATFSGRARRSEYWFWWLFATIVSGVVAWIEGTDNYGLSSIVGLAFLLPNLAVAVRRMHDVGKSGWYLLWNFLPIVGNIMYLVKLCSDSEPGTNMYGENPKGVYAPASA